MLKRLFTVSLLIVTVNFSFAQHFVDKVQFFTDTTMVTAVLKLDVKKLIIHKDVPGRLFPAMFSCKIGDSLNVNDEIALEVRGHFRRTNCYLPPL